MSLLSKLNAKFGRYGIPNLTEILIIGQVFLYVAAQLDQNNQKFGVLDRIQMYPARVLSGEWWRVVTYLFNPPGMNLIFAFFFWYLFYLMGTTLEAAWGAFRYNIYLLIGYVASIACAFGIYFATRGLVPVPATNLFLQGTIFFAFARFFPDFTLNVMLVIPIKIRWLAAIQWVMYAFTFLFGGWMERAMVLASVANYLLFFGNDIWCDIKQGHRRTMHRAQSVRAPQRIVHTCRTCGITSDDAPHMQFRYCSKCDGDSCYCPAHLRDHEHVVAQSAGASSTSGKEGS